MTQEKYRELNPVGKHEKKYYFVRLKYNNGESIYTAYGLDKAISLIYGCANYDVIEYGTEQPVPEHILKFYLERMIYNELMGKPERTKTYRRRTLHTDDIRKSYSMFL